VIVNFSKRETMLISELSVRVNQFHHVDLSQP